MIAVIAILLLDHLTRPAHSAGVLKTSIFIDYGYILASMTEKRLIELETKLAYQEDLIQELNKTIFEQQKRLDQLDNGYRHLLEQTKELADSNSPDKVADEKPPHY